MQISTKTVAAALMLWAASAAGAMAQQAQFTTTPVFVKNDAKGVKITYHGEVSDSRGTPFKDTKADLYAHIGVYTTLSPSTWSHVKTDWGKNSEETCLRYVSENTWELEIGDLREYFSTPTALKDGETITKICILARNSASNAQTDDFFITVYGEGLQLLLTPSEPAGMLEEGSSVSFKVQASDASNLAISVDGTTVASESNATELVGSYTFTGTGDHQVVATATLGDESVSSSLNYVIVKPAEHRDFPGGVPMMGAHRQADGSVTFCLAAPGKKQVALMPGWEDYQLTDKNMMYIHDYEGQRYFWTSVAGLDADTRYPYYYLVDGEREVGDPYAHLVLDGNADRWLKDTAWPDGPRFDYSRFPGKYNLQIAVYHENQDVYDWKVDNFEAPDPRNMVVYEICLRDFTGTAMRDDGNLRWAIERIPYIKGLGVNCVELMPLQQFNGTNSWGYNTNFYMALEKSYGSPDDLKEFVDKCHEAGIAVVLDMVLNHSDGLHPWYQMYSSANNPFYNLPNAPHDNSVLNDWRQEHPLVQQQWTDVIKYWMTKYRIDGFRFDLTMGLADTDSYKGIGTYGYNASRVANLTRLNEVIKSVNPRGIHINEHHVEGREQNEMGALGMLHWNNENPSSRNFAKGSSQNPYSAFRKFSSKEDGHNPYVLLSYAESHDEERCGFEQIGKISDLSTRMDRLAIIAANLILTTDATPMIWQFGELGADESIMAGGDRTAPKTPLWDYYEVVERKALYDTYAALNELRLGNDNLFASPDAVTTWTYNQGSDNNAAMRQITNGTSEIIVMMNGSLTESSKLRVAQLASPGETYRLVTSTTGFTPELTPRGNGTTYVTMPPSSMAVFASAGASAIEGVAADRLDESDAPVEYYNLQGVRVSEPKGLVIRRCGSKAQKVVM